MTTCRSPNTASPSSTARSRWTSRATASRSRGSVDCGSSTGTHPDPGDACSNSCNTKKAFAIICVILAWFAVVIASDFPAVWLATTSRPRTIASAVFSVLSMLSAAIVLVLFGVQSQISETSGVAFGICAYQHAYDDDSPLDIGAPTLSTSGITMAVGAGLVGIAGFAQCCVGAGDTHTKTSEAAYAMM